MHAHMMGAIEDGHRMLSLWAKHFGEAHPGIQQYEVSIPQIPIVEGAATNALMKRS